MESRQLSEVITDAYRPVIAAYSESIRTDAQEIISEHPQHLRPDTEKPNECDDCRQLVSDYADNEWSQYTRNAYLVMIISPNRDAWKDISSDIDSFGEDFDQCMSSCAAIAIAADITEELERLS
jgi:hypothetical protein